MDEIKCKVEGCKSHGKPPLNICSNHDDELVQLNEMHSNIPRWHNVGLTELNEAFERAGEILGENWHNYNRPKFTEIIDNFDIFGDIGYNVLIDKILGIGQYSTSFDDLSGNWRFTGEWEKNQKEEGLWIDSEGMMRYEDPEEEYAKWETCQLISTSLEKSSDNFKENLQKILSSMVERVEILHTGNVSYSSSLFTSFQVTAFLCTSTYTKRDKFSDEIGELGLRILKSKHPVNSKAQQLMGEPKILSKYYDEQYCAFRAQTLLMCHGIVPESQLASVIGIKISDLNHIVDCAELYKSNFRSKEAKKAEKVIREHLGVSSKCTDCNKFLPNPRHYYCRKHNPSTRKSRPSSDKFSSKICKQCKKNKVDEFGNNFQLCKKCFAMKGKGAYDPTFNDWYTGDDIK